MASFFVNFPDWLFRYGDFLQHSDFFTKYVRKTDRTLVVGCGNSDLGLMLFDKLNVFDVTNIDIR